MPSFRGRGGKRSQKTLFAAGFSRASRWQGRDLADDDVRRLASYVQAFQEMRKGEQFVQREIRNRARERQRWALGIPLMLVSCGLLLALRR